MLPQWPGFINKTLRIFALLLLIGLITACMNAVEETESPVKRYRVGGIVTGLSGSGLILQNNAQDNLLIAADGNFVFAFNTPLADGSRYAITVFQQPTLANATMRCDVGNGTGNIAGAEVMSVSITCIINSPILTKNDLVYSSPMVDGITIAWESAQDDVTQASSLEYQIYSSATNNISTLNEILANGVASGAWATDLNITLTMTTVYYDYWNVLVRDESGNMSSYKTSKVNAVLDVGFNGVGYATHNNAAGGDGNDEGRAIALDGDGNILVTGMSRNVTSLSPEYDMVLWKYTTKGILDASFGDDDPAVTDPDVKLGLCLVSKCG